MRRYLFAAARPALALCAMAGAASAQDGIVVDAAGLDRFEAARIELGYTDPRSDAGFEILAAAVVRDGKATLETGLREVMQVEIRLLEAGPAEGLRVRAIVEPGVRHELAWDADRSALEFTGGPYDELIRSAMAEPGEMATESLKVIYRDFDDPVARLMALRNAWLDGEDEEQITILAELQSLLGESRTFDLLGALAEQRAAFLAQAVMGITALNLAGEEVRVADVLAGNRYTLLEFWASWCAPCFAEIPYLQAAYERFGDEGFEILAFNLDDEPEDWREASGDRYDIPWLNVTDGLAFESPVASLFRINAIPASFLLASDGATVARDLRGESLEIRLGELLAPAASVD
ncbi:MAG: TlpA disulfide reductase family protein [Gammaproteobacteria bacterium]|nr:TlpA disulfide reductase family protein [Gammaproteobacteria bacterium]MXW45551.1 TlpA family protein disulfide reductase [Gammaproteobacteria bacterium]MYD01469.1 TlpA family protein disulfide reductase [Gammaproteobacteria bacterium]MYI26163.1 TlpA family protein disulfide reductase [Gammaproteobacteria bacterium]